MFSHNVGYNITVMKKKSFLKSMLPLLFIAVAIAVLPCRFSSSEISYAAMSDLPVKCREQWYDDAEFNDYETTLNVVEDMLSGLDAGQKEDFKNNPVVIAVIDTGINFSHELFQNVLYSNPDEKNDGLDNDKNGYRDDVCGWDFVSGDNDPKDECEKNNLIGHGSHVAGIIAQEIIKYGLTDYVKILPLRAGDKSGGFSAKDVINAVNYAVKVMKDKNVTMIMNMSFKNSVLAGGWGHGSSLDSAVQTAVSAGAIMVAAAGNDGVEYPAGSPASLENVIGVMAYGEDGYIDYNYGDAYDIAAPGKNIISAAKDGSEDFTVKNGTSMATPMVSFAAAVLEIKCLRDSAMVYETMTNTSSSETGTVSKKDGSYTAGKLNLAAFMEYNPIQLQIIECDVAYEGEYLYQNISDAKRLEFEVRVKVYDRTDFCPDGDPIYDRIAVKIVKTDKTFDLSKGKIIATTSGRKASFLPEEPGYYAIYSSSGAYVNSGSNVINLKVDYAPVSEVNLYVEKPGDLKEDETYLFTVNELYKIDTANNAVTWSIYDKNDKLIKTVTSDALIFRPETRGEYKIVCKIGGNVIEEFNVKVGISTATQQKIIGGVSSAVIISVVAALLAVALIKTIKRR